jgi:hypothetical protein
MQMPNPNDPTTKDESTAGVVPGIVGADGTPEDRGQSRDLEHESRPGQGENQAGFLKEKDTPQG